MTMNPFRPFGRDSRGVDAWRAEIAGLRLVILSHATSGIELRRAAVDWTWADQPTSGGFRSLEAARDYAVRMLGDKP